MLAVCLCPTVQLSVSLSRDSVLTECRITQSMLHPNCLNAECLHMKIPDPMVSLPKGVQDVSGVGLKSAVFNQTLLYLRNCARLGHSYNGRQMGSFTCPSNILNDCIDMVN